MQSFNKSGKELVTHFDKWRYFLKHLENFDDIPQILNEPIFEKAFKTAELDTMPLKEWEVYQRNKLVYLELKAAMDTAREDGMKIGILQGKTLRIAKVMKDKGEPIDVIVDYTGLSIEEIEKL